LHYWQGYCPTHQRLVPDELTALRDAHPGSALLVHPECAQPVRAVADYVGSTEQIVRHAGAASGKTFLIGTESGILHRLRKLHPQNTYIEASELLFCTNMKKTSLEAIVQCLEVEAPAIHLDPTLAERALLPLRRMLDLEGGD
jgi:quinolinate synthase